MTRWKLPCSFDGRSSALVIRAALRALDYDFTSEQTTRHFTKFAFVISLDRFAYAYRFEVSHPEEFTLDTWSETPGHGGQLHFLEISFTDPLAKKAISVMLLKFAASLPRLPWKFTFGQQLGVGVLTPELLRARKHWAKAGVTAEGVAATEPLKLDLTTLGESETFPMAEEVIDEEEDEEEEEAEESHQEDGAEEEGAKAREG